MKHVVNISLGNREFTIDEDACQRLTAYLESFKSRLDDGLQASEVMDEVELRIAELFSYELNSKSKVVSIAMVERVISRLGMPDGSYDDSKAKEYNEMNATKKYYRDPDCKVFGGVCGGLAAHFNVDVTLVRLVFIVALFCGSVGFWVYVILWIIAPKAETPAQKCELRGIPATAENMARFSSSRR